MQNAKLKSTFQKISEIKITSEDTVIYSELSKDYNPIHQTGVVYGMQLMLLVEEQIRKKQKWKQVTGFNYYFRLKVYENQTVDIWFNGTGKFETKVNKQTVGEGVIFGE